MFRTHRVVAVSAAAALTFGGLVGGGIVLAEVTDNTTQPPSIGNQSEPNGKESLDAYIAQLAANLGISEDALRAAINKTNLDFVDKAVADGKITEEQAAAIRERLAAGTGGLFGIGTLHMPGMGGGDEGGGIIGRIFGHGGDEKFRIEQKDGGPSLGIMGAIGQASAETAAFLGITEDELHTALADGKSLATIAEEHGKSRDALKTFLAGRATEEIDALVAGGTLTTEQGAKLKELLTSNLDRIIDSTRPAMGERGVPDMGGIERHQMPGGKIGPGGPTAPSEATPPAGTSGFRNKGRTVSPDIS